MSLKQDDLIHSATEFFSFINHAGMIGFRLFYVFVVMMIRLIFPSFMVNEYA